MHARTWSAALVMALSFGVVSRVEAQRRTHVGPHVSYNFDAEKAGIGGQLGLPLTSRLDFYPSFDIFFVDQGSLFGLNADFKIHPDPASALYLGAGLNLARLSVNGNSDTNAGLNLLGGLEASFGAIHPYAELRLILGDGSAVQLSTGLNFTIGQPRTQVR